MMLLPDLKVFDVCEFNMSLSLKRQSSFRWVDVGDDCDCCCWWWSKWCWLLWFRFMPPDWLLELLLFKRRLLLLLPLLLFRLIVGDGGVGPSRPPIPPDDDPNPPKDGSDRSFAVKGCKGGVFRFEWWFSCLRCEGRLIPSLTKSPSISELWWFNRFSLCLEDDDPDPVELWIIELMIDGVCFLMTGGPSDPRLGDSDLRLWWGDERRWWSILLWCDEAWRLWCEPKDEWWPLWLRLWWGWRWGCSVLWCDVLLSPDEFKIAACDDDVMWWISLSSGLFFPWFTDGLKFGFGLTLWLTEGDAEGTFLRSDGTFSSISSSSSSSGISCSSSEPESAGSDATGESLSSLWWSPTISLLSWFSGSGWWLLILTDLELHPLLTFPQVLTLCRMNLRISDKRNTRRQTPHVSKSSWSWRSDWTLLELFIWLLRWEWGLLWCKEDEDDWWMPSSRLVKSISPDVGVSRPSSISMSGDRRGPSVSVRS